MKVAAIQFRAHKGDWHASAAALSILVEQAAAGERMGIVSRRSWKWRERSSLKKGSILMIPFSC